MHIISQKMLRTFWADHPPAESPLRAWYKAVSRAVWADFAEVRALYPHADQVGKFTVFNIGGNKYRLVAAVHYRGKRIYVRFIGTHRDYEKIDARTV